MYYYDDPHHALGSCMCVWGGTILSTTIFSGTFKEIKRPNPIKSQQFLSTITSQCDSISHVHEKHLQPFPIPLADT